MVGFPNTHHTPGSEIHSFLSRHSMSLGEGNSSAQRRHLPDHKTVTASVSGAAGPRAVDEEKIEARLEGVSASEEDEDHRVRDAAWGKSGKIYMWLG